MYSENAKFVVGESGVATDCDRISRPKGLQFPQSV